MYTRLRALLHHINHAKMSTATVNNPSVACCTVPPVESDYTPKGSFKSYGGISKVYVTGPEKVGDIAIVCVYDIFGFQPQTQQGADILAKELNAQVLMPDFFEPVDAWPVEGFPPKNDEEKQKFQEFFGGPAKPQDSVSKLLAVTKALKQDGAKFVGAYGLCWGGKVTILAGSHSGTPLDAVAAVHPAMLVANDTDNLQVPLGLYPTKDEDFKEYEKMVDIISKKPFAAKNDHKYYKETFHGFAGARADLNDPENVKYYTELYATLIKFFGTVNGTHSH